MFELGETNGRYIDVKFNSDMEANNFINNANGQVFREKVYKVKFGNFGIFWNGNFGVFL